MNPSAPIPGPTWLGRVSYAVAHRAQRERREAILRGDAPEAIWLLEHDSVVTTGRRAAEVDVDALARRGVPVVATERGGLATWHGPGQLVGYLLIDVASRQGTIHGLVCALEAGLIAWLASRGWSARRESPHRGVFVAGNKVAAIGLHVRRGVTMHGFALNLTCDLSAYDAIVPCGLRDFGVAAVGDEAPGAAAASVGDFVRAALVDALGPRR